MCHRPKEFCKAILKKINHRVPHVSLQALILLDSCVNNCGLDFKKEVASQVGCAVCESIVMCGIRKCLISFLCAYSCQDFINNMRAIILNSHPKVASYLKMLIRRWAEEFKDEAQLRYDLFSIRSTIFMYRYEDIYRNLHLFQYVPLSVYMYLNIHIYCLCLFPLALKALNLFFHALLF